MSGNQNSESSSTELEAEAADASSANQESETMKYATAADVKKLASEIGEAKLKGIEKEVKQRLAGTMLVTHELFEKALKALSKETKDAIRNTEEIKNLISGDEPTFTSVITSNRLESRSKFAKVVGSVVDVITKIELERAISGDVQRAYESGEEQHANAQEFFDYAHEVLERGASEIRKAKATVPPKKEVDRWYKSKKTWGGVAAGGGGGALFATTAFGQSAATGVTTYLAGLGIGTAGAAIGVLPAITAGAVGAMLGGKLVNWGRKIDWAKVNETGPWAKTKELTGKGWDKGWKKAGRWYEGGTMNVFSNNFWLRRR